MPNTVSLHLAEYVIEGSLLGTFMLAACTAVVLFEHPHSPIRRAIIAPLARRSLIGVLMGLTAIALIYSPWGQRSGAHMNPATTLTFWLLGKVATLDALGYVFGQFLGALAGVGLARLFLGRRVMHDAVRYAATQPGRRGLRMAWLAEFIIAFGMMSMVLVSSNHASTAPYTGLFAGALVAIYITIEAPFSGMSMNPARTLASALPARVYRGLWIYFTAPPLAMSAAAFVYTAFAGGHVYCAKLQHSSPFPCLFHCEIDQLRPRHPLLE